MPLRHLLGTSVYSQPLRRNPNLDCLRRWKRVGDDQCAISIVTIAEVKYGLALERNELRKRKFDHILRNRLTVLPSNDLVWDSFAELKAHQRNIGEIVSDLDLLIATTAMLYGLSVATLNRNDFSRIENLEWEDWST